MLELACSAARPSAGRAAPATAAPATAAPATATAAPGTLVSAAAASVTAASGRSAPAVPLSSAEESADAAPGSSGLIGTDHPLLVRGAAADGGWVALCQAREDSNADGVIEVSVGSRGELLGDRLDSFLVEGSGEGEAIDAFVAADSSGRRLVIVQGEHLILRDSHNQSDLDLAERGALSGTDQSPFAPHRAARFSSDGRRLLYLRQHGARDWVVVLDLATEQEIEIDPGPGLLWRAEFDASGEWVVMRVVDMDTNGDGRWGWPYGKPSASELPCVSPVPAYRVPEVPADKPSVRVALARGEGRVRRVPGFISSFGAGGLLRRSPDRSLFVDRPGAPDELWCGSDCDGRLLHADPARGLLLVACATEQGPRSVRLVTREAHQELGVVVGPFEVDTIVEGEPRLVPLYTFAAPDTSLVDLETRQLLPLAPRDRVIATHGVQVLVRRREALFLGDGRAPLSEVGPSDPLSPILRQGPLVLARPWVVDLGQGKAVGRVEGEGLALSSRGAVLVARVAADAHRTALGPLEWMNPVPQR